MSEIKTSEEKKDDVFITDLTIHKVRHLKNIHIPLSKDERKHLILTGKNGSGKTSVLESLKNSIWEKLEPKIHQFGKGMVDNVTEAKKLSVEFNSVEKFREYYTSGHFQITFYAARRLTDMIVPKGLNKVNLREQYNRDEKPGKQFIQYIVNLKAEKSFARDDNDHKTVKDIESWFEFFEKSLKEIFEDPTLKIEFDRKNYNYKILQEGKESFDFNTMADGYSAIIDMVTDLILRMEKHKTKGYDIQGVVLIDELETHLHIALQKKIFPFLTRFFPRIQFIVTTHSPFILNSIDNAVIYDLENNLLISDLSGYSYDGIVEGYFDNDKYSELIKNKIERYEQLLNQEKRTEAEEEQMRDLRMYLKNIPDPLALELKTKFQQIELNRIGKTND
jgi:predicted ATP-dependent endonuclease of OLD family